MHEEFSLPTEDGLTCLTGELMLLDNANQATGVLLMVPGGWFAERDGFMGDTYTEADLMYLRIAKRVHERGFFVARYDNRGVSGNEFSIGIKRDGADPFEDTKRYLERCVDSEIRRSVTPETQVSDLAKVYQFVSKYSGVDPANVVVFAHSEGGIHVARLIGHKQGTKNLFNPKGVVFAGVIAGSPSEVMRFQLVDRYVDEVMCWDLDGDGVVNAHDVEACFDSSFLKEVGVCRNSLSLTTTGWTEAKLRQFFTASYEEQRSAALLVPDNIPFPLNNKNSDGQTDDHPLEYVTASHRWLKQFYSDETAMVSLLDTYPGRVAYHFAELDRQLSCENEIGHVTKNSPSLACDLKTVVHKNRGHAFASSKPVSGPMDVAAEDLFVQEILGMLTAK